MIRFGRIKSYSTVTIEDHLKHLIWTSAHGGRHDEESERPVISTDEVTQEIIDHELIVPVITIQTESSNHYGTAWYLHRDREIFAIAIWDDDTWKTLADMTATLTAPVVFLSLPRILGQEKVRFVCSDLKSEKAVRMS